MSDIAVVGYAADLPGAADAASAWEIMRAGICTVSEVPEDRWSSRRFLARAGLGEGRSITRRAGVLADPFRFDPAAFGLSRREALQMDPQQRLLLMATQHALDHAGINPARLEKARTGVYIGASGSDYSTQPLQDPAIAEAGFMLGNTLSILANRISYVWDFRGPSFTIDTACSSSLFALHQAARDITEGEIDTAIVGGVNLLLSPLPFVGFSRAGMLSPDGLCRAFAAGANGYVRSEGVVVFVLQRTTLAAREGRPQRSLIAATGVNTNGHGAFIALPSAAQQAQLIAKVMGAAGSEPETLLYAEAHGTGTAVGDPIEAQALAEAIAQHRRTPLPFGSSKTNFGHLEPASGLVGLLKAQLSLENRILPPSLHAETLNPAIDFPGLNLDLVRTPRPLELSPVASDIAVNSFGFGGANAHVILRAPRAEKRPASKAAAPPRALLVSAPSQQALQDDLATWLNRAKTIAAEQPPVDTLWDEVASANHATSRHTFRQIVPCPDLDGLIAGLGDAIGEAQFTRALGDQLGVAFVFGGNGGLWDGVGRALYLGDEIFRHRFDALAKGFRALGGPDLAQLLMTPQAGEVFSRAETAQPLTFALQRAMSDTLTSRGLAPRVSLGHSLGEVAAAVTAGRLSDGDAISLIHSRSMLLAQLHGKGGMAALAMARAEAQALIATSGLMIDIAADNAPASVTISGTEADLQALLALARAERRAGKLLDIAYPYHSRAFDPLKADFLEALQDLRPQPAGKVTFLPTAPASSAEKTRLDAAYWWQNARGEVQFRQASEAAIAMGIQIFVEISPRTLLASYLRDTLAERGKRGAVIATLDPGLRATRRPETICREVLAHGGTMNEDQVLGPRPDRLAARLPKTRFHLESLRLAADRGPDIFARRAEHPLLGAALDDTGSIFESRLSLHQMSWLKDHVVAGRVLVPATALAELLAEAARRVLGQDAVTLADLQLLSALELSETGETLLRTTYLAQNRRLTIEQVTGTTRQIVAQARVLSEAPLPAAAVLLATGEKVPDLYSKLAARGLAYGPTFARLDQVALADRVIDVHLGAGEDSAGLALDPAALDAVLHGLALPLLAHDDGTVAAFIPQGFSRWISHGAGQITGGRISLVHTSSQILRADVTFLGADGAVLAEAEGLSLVRITTATAQGATLWEEVWVPRATAPMGDLCAVLAGRMSPEALPQDADLLRKAYATRLAFDLAVDPEAETRDHVRYRLARDWLVANGEAETDASGTLRLNRPCPAPSREILLQLLGETGRMVDFQAALTAECQPWASTQTRMGSPLARIAEDLLCQDDVTLAGRLVLVVGGFDLSLVAALRAKGADVVIGLGDAEALSTTKNSLRPGEALHLVDLSAPHENLACDLILGVCASRHLGRGMARRLVPELRSGGQVRLLEDEVDLFALLTGGHDSGDFVTETRAAFQSHGVELAQVDLAGHSLTCLVGKTAPAQAVLAEPPYRIDAGLSPLDLAREIHRAARDKLGLVVVPEPSRAAEIFAYRRVAVNETGNALRVILAPEGVAEDALAEAVSRQGEDEVILAETMLLPRLRPVAEKPSAGQRLVLDRGARGSAAFQTLNWRPEDMPSLKPDEILVRVLAAGVNFRDVLWAQGMLPAEALDGAFSGFGLGMECAGEVTAPGKSSFQKGDLVFGFAASAMASHVVMKAALAMPLPAGIAPEHAAALPVAALTAELALVDIARLQKGERVLIHGAAGGVGLACVSRALDLGAIVHATAGSPEKRRYLQAIGVQHVHDSRALRFQAEIMAASGGRGVDVVVNSLAGEAMEQSLDCLAPFGRFVELGKRDIWANAMIGLRALRSNISLHVLDADRMLNDTKTGISGLLARLNEDLTSTNLGLPPVWVVPGEDAVFAFRLMQRARHIGKIVLTPPSVVSDRSPAAQTELPGDWLITGGTSGFGLVLARELAARGARQLWLVGRRGEIDTAVRAEIEATGCRLRVTACDLADEVDLRGLIADVKATPPKAFLHAATHYGDARLGEEDAGVARKIWAVKVTAAQRIAAALAETDLKQIIVLTSLASRIGNLGQGIYAAANGALEDLMRARHARGLCGLALALGPIADTGLLAREPRLRAFLQAQGDIVSSASEMKARIFALLDRGTTTGLYTIAPLNDARLGDLTSLRGSLFAESGLASQRGTTRIEKLGDLIARTGEKDARRIVLDLMRGEVARLLAVGEGEVDPLTPLGELGFDSLMAVSLKLALEEQLGEISLAGVTPGTSLAGLASGVIRAALGGDGAAIADQMAQVHVDDADLSDATRQAIIAGARHDP